MTTFQIESGRSFLITGGAGFIGRRLISHLLSSGVRNIRVVDNLSNGDAQALSALAETEQCELPRTATTPIQLVVGDVRNPELAEAACQGGIDVIVHLAANTSVPDSIIDPGGDCVANVIGTFNYLDAARKTNIPRFIFASSSAVTGECDPPIHERIPARPISPYGASKAAGEAYCSAFASAYGIATVALRFGNVYGPGSTRKQSVVAQFLRNAFSGEPIVIYGDGNQTRDFIFVDDLVKAIELAFLADGISGEIFQIATSRETTIRELAEELSAALDDEGFARPTVLYGAARAGDVRRNFSDTSKARLFLHWYATTKLPEGLRSTVRWAADRLRTTI